MREIRTSGSMSGERKRSGDLAATAPLLDSTHVREGWGFKRKIWDSLLPEVRWTALPLHLGGVSKEVGPGPANRPGRLTKHPTRVARPSKRGRGDWGCTEQGGWRMILRRDKVEIGSSGGMGRGAIPAFFYDDEPYIERQGLNYAKDNFSWCFGRQCITPSCAGSGYRAGQDDLSPHRVRCAVWSAWGKGRDSVPHLVCLCERHRRHTGVRQFQHGRPPSRKAGVAQHFIGPTLPWQKPSQRGSWWQPGMLARAS